MQLKTCLRVALLALPPIISASPIALAQSPSFQGLGSLGGGTSFIPGDGHSISGDGSVVVGNSDISRNGITHAVRWSGGIIRDLGTLGGVESAARGVSADGKVIVGESQLRGSSNSHAFSYSGGVMQDLGTLGGSQSAADGVSANGNVIVGFSQLAGDARSHAVRWTNGTIADLGTLGGQNSRASGVSADGNVIVGSSQITGSTASHAFRWTNGIMSDLGTLGGAQSFGNAVSADGNVVVGRSQIVGSTTYHAFRWSGGVMQDLGTLRGNNFSEARGVSSTGAVVVGNSFSSFGGRPVFSSSHAFRWTAATGMQSVASLLRAAGVNIGTWRLTNANGISYDGTVIVGNGENPNRASQAWIARIGSGLDAGFITVPDVTQSFASLGAVGQTAGASLATNFMTVTRYATQGGSATQNGSPYSVFVSAGYDSDPTVAGTLGATAKLNDNGLIAGATVGADNIKTNMTNSGSSRFNAGVFGGFIAQVPVAGLQWLAGANGIYLDGKISRGYLNGISPVTSTGSTHGAGVGLAARLGYTFEVAPRAQVTPFGSYTYTRVDFNGYRETDGPIASVINDFRAIEQVTRTGLDTRLTLMPGTWLWGTLAWSHRVDSGRDPAISGTLIGLFPLSVGGGISPKRDWLEAGGGIRYGTSANGALTASLTAIVPERVAANFIAQIGYSLAF